MQHPTATTHDRHELGRWRRLCFANHHLGTGTIHLLPHPLDRHRGRNFVHRTDHGPRRRIRIRVPFASTAWNGHSATGTRSGTKTNRATTTTTRCPGRVREHCNHMKEGRACEREGRSKIEPPTSIEGSRRRQRPSGCRFYIPVCGGRCQDDSYVSTDGPAAATPARYQYQSLLPSPDQKYPPSPCIPHFRYGGSRIYGPFSSPTITTPGRPSPLHPSPSIDCTTTVGPLPPF